MSTIIIMICLLLLVVFSILTKLKSRHLKFVAILSGITVLCIVVGYCILGISGCAAVIFYTSTVNVIVQSIYFSYHEDSLGSSCILQCAVYLLIVVLGYATKSYSLTGVILVLMFLSIRLREDAMLSHFESYSANYQNRLLRNQVEEVQHIYMTMRGWRHDYHSHLQSLKAKLNRSQIRESLQYLNELEQDLADIHQIVESGNVNVDAILNSKLSLAMEQGIDVNIKVSIPPKLPLSDIDCCVLLGNLIDNAIEACEKVQDRKYIRLYIGLYKKQLYMSIANATNEVVRKFDEEYITTKRGNHGHGLKRINTVVEKYHGYINRQNEPGVFVSEIMIPMNQTCTK